METSETEENRKEIARNSVESQRLSTRVNPFAKHEKFFRFRERFLRCGSAFATSEPFARCDVAFSCPALARLD